MSWLGLRMIKQALVISAAKRTKSAADGCPGAKIRSEGKGRGLGFGKGKGPVGVPGKKRDWAKMLEKQRKRRGD